MKKNSLNPFSLLCKSRKEIVAKQLTKQTACKLDCEARLLECKAKLLGLQAEYEALGGTVGRPFEISQKPIDTLTRLD